MLDFWLGRDSEAGFLDVGEEAEELAEPPVVAGFDEEGVADVAVEL